MKVGIAGLGLIGGSMAKSIKSRTAHTVYGTDIKEETMLLAQLCGAMDDRLTPDTIRSCELLLIALRPQDAIDWVERHAPEIPRTAVVVDLCGVKRQVVARLSGLASEYGFSYIGGHPMAGRERSGFPAADADLFVGASMILTPDACTEPQMLASLKVFFLDLGFAGLTFASPDDHDRMIAYTSQLAHIVSSAYVRSPASQNRRGFSAGSFRDMTRVARLDEDMWTELFLLDADYLSQELDTLIRHLTQYSEALKTADADALRALLREGREMKASAGEC